MILYAFDLINSNYKFISHSVSFNYQYDNYTKTSRAVSYFKATSAFSKEIKCKIIKYKSNFIA